MKTYKINYLAPNTLEKQRSGKYPVYIHKVATYHCDTEEEAIQKFHKYHDTKKHQFQFIWEETDIDRMRACLTHKLMPNQKILKTARPS